MSFMANPSIPSLPVSTQVEVKTAITNIANWINLFNKSLGDVVGTSSSTVDSSYYSSALYKFVESTLLGDQAVANIIKKLEGKITETQLHKDLVNRINLIDDPDTGLITKLNETNSNLAQEAIDRAEADIAEAEARIQGLFDESEARNAAILVETEARILADSAEATSRETLATQVRGSYTGTNLASVTSGLIYSEREARSTADSTEVSARQALSTKVTGASDPTSLTLSTLSSGLLYDEKTARSTADSSEVTARETLSTKVIGTVDPTGLTLPTLTSGLIYDEKTARSSADSAEVTARQSLSATLTGYTDPSGKTLSDISTGIIAQEKTARVTADNANASSISTLSAQVNNVTTGLPAAHSAIDQINTVSSSSTSANAKALASVKSAVEDPSTGLSTKASVTQLNTAITTLDTALSQDISQVSTTVAGNTASIETLSSSVDGIKAEYTVKLNTNNKVAGFGLMLSENEPSIFEIVADKFAIVNYDGVTSTVPFQVTGGVTVLKSALIGELAADKITSGYLRAINISTGTAANSVKFYEEGYTNVPLHSSAYSGIFWNGWVGTSILTTSDLYFGHNNISLPINRRVKSGTVKVFMLWTGVTDSAMSIYYRINGGSWICVAEGSDSQADYGAASTSWIGDVTIPVNGSIEFGMRPTSCSGWYYNGEKLEMRTTNFTVQMVNF